MNKVCKQYIKEVKALFPIRQKPEKAYLKKLTSDIEAYCEDANATTKQDLYDNYGKPAEVVGNYISALETDTLMKRLRVSKAVRACAVTLIVAIIVATGAFCLNQYLMKKVWDENIIGSTYREKIVVIDETE